MGLGGMGVGGWGEGVLLVSSEPKSISLLWGWGAWGLGGGEKEYYW